jgi:hypothetical protein
MLRETIRANLRTDVELEASKLRDKCVAAGLETPLTDLLVRQTREILASLVEQGERIASVGSQMEATRELSGDGYLIRLIFREGGKRGLFEQWLDKLRGV